MKHRLSNLSKIYRDDICRKMNILPIVLCMFCMRNAYSLMAATPSVSETLQQNRKIKGRVVDVNNEPMIGVSVLEKGTTNGVITDFDGNFTLDIRGNSAVLVCSYIGYITAEIQVGNQTALHVQMSEDVKAIDEVVVIGYGTTTKKELTGSVTSIGKDDFKAGNISNPIQLLQGQIAGLNIARPDGADPTGGFEIQLRGLTTMKGGSGPLIVIDGVEGGNLANLNANDIESIDVLKDGSAAAIYGTRGTNGVILVTTRKGKPGHSLIEFSSYWTTQSVTRKPEFLSADEFRSTLKEYLPNQAATLDYGASTDWFDEVTRDTPLSQYYSLAASGGSEKLTYRGNISWHDDKGIVRNSGNQQLRMRFNVSQTALNDRLKLDYNISYSTAKKNFSGYEVMKQAVTRNPTEPVYDTEGRTPISGGYYYNDGPFKYYNPVAMQNESTNETLDREFSGSVHASLKIIDPLKINALASLVETNTRNGYYQTQYYPIDFGTNGRATSTNSLSSSKQFEVNADFNHSFGDHKIQAIAGYSYYDYWNERYYGMNYGYDTDIFSFYNMGAGSALSAGKASLTSNKQSNKLISFFGRVMYNFSDKYLLSASVRYEGSSRFGANNKWGTFPAVSLGWRITQEEFMKKFRWLDDLKLRAGFGVTGNQDIDNYQSLSLLTFGSRFLYDGKWTSTVYPNSNPNPDLKWEKKEEFNVGLDFSVLKGRLTGTIDYYVRHTKDLLNSYTVPVPPNLYDTMFANVGQINNSGIEISLGASPVVTKDFTWNLNLTFARNTNKLASFSNNEYAMVQMNTGYFSEDLKTYTQRIVEGEPIGNFYGPKWLGFDANGDNIFEDLDDDGKLSDGDNQVIGNAYPDFTFSIQNSFSYKNFDLSFLFRGSVGNDVLNMSRLYYEGFSYFGSNNILKSTLDHPEYKGGAIYSSRFIEDGSFVKLDNLTLGYNVPLKGKIISKMRIYVTGQNLLTLTKYKGMDPEVHLAGLEPGIEWYTFYPRTKTYLLGLNITF